MKIEQQDLVHTAKICGEQLLVVINDILGNSSHGTKKRYHKFRFDKNGRK